MKRLMPAWCLVAILAQTVGAQSSLSINTFNHAPDAFRYLLLPNTAIAHNDTVHEIITDLAEPMLADSVIEKRKQHHRVFLIGWLLHAFGGYNWRALSMHKQKFVGTVVRHTRSREEEYTEYDINFDINFHLKKYLWKIFGAYDRQRELRRQDYRRSHHRNYDSIPFVRDTNCIDIRNYRLHCELTPPRAYRHLLNYVFYPTLPEAGDLAKHPSFGTNRPVMGFYGTYCLDCNHSCHPELHPYEWVWWLKTLPGDSTRSKTWFFGLMHESSNRMKNWSREPLCGSIKIPFAKDCSKAGDTVLRIYVEHLVFGTFAGMGEVLLADNAVKLSGAENSVIQLEGLPGKFMMVVFSHPIKSDDYRIGFSEMNYDRGLDVLTGYFHIATNINALYTARVTFD
ncbi:MAG: hypothetical protein NZM35_00385 [Chitinophagales bacterium]|nr:hypothetical protein [Chitinophagales bacterium]